MTLGTRGSGASIAASERHRATLRYPARLLGFISGAMCRAEMPGDGSYSPNSRLAPKAGCRNAASANAIALTTMTALRKPTPSFLLATVSAVANASRYATPFSTSTRVAAGSSEIGAQLGPGSCNGDRARDHTSALCGAITASHPMGIGTH